MTLNIGMSKVMRCSRYGNGGGGRMHAILNKWIVLSTWGCKWQLMEDVHGMWYTERMSGIEYRRVLKSVLSNRILEIEAKKRLYEVVIVPTAFY